MEINSIIICTVDREPDYIHQNLARLLFTLKDKKEIHIVVDGPSYRNYSIYKNFCKIYLNNKVDESLKDHPFKKAKYNYIRCLQLSYHLGGFNLILEDDVLLSSNWHEKIKEIEMPQDEEWILSLNCIQGIESSRGYEEFKSKRNSQGLLVTWCKPFGVIYKPSTLHFTAYSLENYKRDIPHDIIVGGILYESGKKIYECVPTLIEHIGKFSSINKGMVWKTTKDNYGRFDHQCVHPCELYGN